MSSYVQDVVSSSDQSVSRISLRTILRLKLKTFSESRLNSTWKETTVVIPASAIESECSTLIDFATDETLQSVEGSGEGGSKNGDYRLEEENCSWGSAPKPSRGKTASMRHHNQLPFRQINFDASTGTESGEIPWGRGRQIINNPNGSLPASRKNPFKTMPR
ncbi:hypothetical protein HETIRDRAFT_423766 [Heterobasidion irregulare TC 32-1]|uniref:Uncharacterized protein n=1 Tax=Heterobasidion irregulare (strain TC 32-1) TaxID=747525 RepID=W4KLD0_HETIT|nr:uncharacterized protein HETIRDRAFT_423766 [Heterobasidion irregulare TC 32-1]ETW86632.1 hypothetical protein HETIRDRAFT_423766 [Heterobasidion irregulare TC 32-1]